MRVLFVQFANSMFPRFGVSDGYWDAFYATYADYGYVRMEDAFEVPKWIAEACYFLPEGSERKICWVHHSTIEAVDEIRTGGYDFVLFSVMTCTKGFTEEIIQMTNPSQQFVIGGYDKWIYEAAKRFKNVHTADTMQESATLMGLSYKAGTDYSLFNGWTVLPRLTLSYGCLNNCKFCIVPHTTSVVVDAVIEQQVDSFRDLNFKLIYIDDKTFGQARNFRIIGQLRERILEYNKDFIGFVVQTTTGMLVRRAQEFKDLGVVVAEIGLETYNDSILKLYRKPSSERMIRKSIETAGEKGVKIIPNLIVGIPEETEVTYTRTKNFIAGNAENLFGVNFAMYTDYSSPDCVGEVDFAASNKVALHRQFWRELNQLATDKILDRNKITNNTAL